MEKHQCSTTSSLTSNNRPSNKQIEKVGKFSFANRPNDSLSDVCLDESEKQIKKTLKTKILETIPDKWDMYIYFTCDSK
jgi:hypothetical protein